MIRTSTRSVAAPVAKAPTVNAGAELLVLARVTAPQYTASNLRSASGNGEERFRAAMVKYSAGEYAAVTTTDVQRIAAAYLAAGARSVVIARPGDARPRVVKERS